MWDACWSVCVCAHSGTLAWRVKKGNSKGFLTHISDGKIFTLRTIKCRTETEGRKKAVTNERESKEWLLWNVCTWCTKNAIDREWASASESKTLKRWMALYILGVQIEIIDTLKYTRLVTHTTHQTYGSLRIVLNHNSMSIPRSQTTRGECNLNRGYHK